MALIPRLTKRCEKCGRTQKVRPRETKCKQMERNALGRTGYWCYGELTRVVAPKVDRAIKRATELERKRDAAHENLKAAIKRVKLATTAITRWQRRIASIERSIFYRDHPDQKPTPKPRVKRTRKIRVETEEA
jgi:hypothetical protein